MESYKNITPELMQYLKEIASKMKNNRASVMVGAGFSKNADAIVQTDKTFLDWNALGNVFFKKVNGHDPTGDNKYMNVLKLAEEVEAAYGRTVLNELIKESLPDAEYAPSILHEKLMKLNWRDIFTTNYDTLLERTQERIADRHYTVVLNKEDLIYSAEPRIIKLHGSFPSSLPFIITEEDYRQYPKNSAVFVNTVQQALIENVLCLEGFSGEDPNFLNWIGWIRDNIGKDLASKIYLVGIFNFSKAQLKLLNSRNITVIDMSECEGIDKGEYKEGLELFFDTLAALTEEKNEVKWPSEKIPHQGLIFNEKEVEETIQEWERSRKTYPGWIIVPWQQRDNLLTYTQIGEGQLFNIDQGSLTGKTALKFLYEYNWRLNHCLCPIKKSTMQTYEKVLFSLNPYYEKVHFSEEEVLYDRNNADWSVVAHMWMELLLDLLRAYREQGRFDQFENVEKKIKCISNALSVEQKAKLDCEIVRKHLFQFNIKEAKLALDMWQRNISLPVYEIQRAGLLMKLGDVSQALKIAIEELSYIRKGNNKEINHYKMSMEAYLVLFISYARHALGLKEKNEVLDSKQIVNPFEEINLFEASLKEYPLKESEREEFDLNRVTRTIFHSEDRNRMVAFQFVRFYEEIGRSVNCNRIVASKDAFKEAIRRINPHASLWSLILQIETNDVKISDVVWNRESIMQMSDEEISQVSELCLFAIRNNMEYIEGRDNIREVNFQTGLAKVIPEILSRLCTRMSNELKQKTLDLLDSIYKAQKPQNFENIKDLAGRLVDSMSENMKLRNFNVMMRMSPYAPKTHLEKIHFADIFDSFSYHESSIAKSKNISVEFEVKEMLFQLLDQEENYEIAVMRLFHLYHSGLLTEKEEELFAKKLWNNVDENDLPKIPSNKSKRFLFLLPIPYGIDLEARIKKYILDLPFNKEMEGVSLGYDVPLFLLELRYCTNSITFLNGIKWSEDEVEKIVGKIINTWNADKKIIMRDIELGGEGNKSIIMRKYRFVDDVLFQIMRSNEFKKVDKEILGKLCDDFQKVDLPCSNLKMLVRNKKEAIEEINKQIYSNDSGAISDACQSLFNLIYGVKEEEKQEYSNLLEQISFMILIRKSTGLRSMIILMHDLLYCNMLPESEIIKNNLLAGLEYLLEESNIKVNTYKYSTNQCINLRSAANALAYEMYIKYNDDSKVVRRLSGWKEISNDLNEFSEVRNCWLDIE